MCTDEEEEAGLWAAFALTWTAFNTLFVHRVSLHQFVLFFNFRFFTTRFTRTRRTTIVGIRSTSSRKLICGSLSYVLKIDENATSTTIRWDRVSARLLVWVIGTPTQRLMLTTLHITPELKDGLHLRNISLTFSYGVTPALTVSNRAKNDFVRHSAAHFTFPYGQRKH